MYNKVITSPNLLTLIGFNVAHIKSKGLSLYECECGKQVIKRTDHVNSNRIKSCGCIRVPHGLYGHPLYKKYYSILSRCIYRSSPCYKNYGGRGIFICKEWTNNPIAFVKWGLANGWKPGLQIDRIDNDGPYSPDNCRFVTNKINMRNSRNAKLTASDVRKIKGRLRQGDIQREIAEHFNVSRRTIGHIKNNSTWQDIS